MGNVYALHPPQHPIRHFVRIGHTGYRTLENLLTVGRARIRHAVFDAAHLHRQQNILATLRDSVIPEKSRNVRRIGKVELSDQALIKRLGKKSRRLELLHRTLGQITHELETVPIARTPVSKTRPVKKVS